MNLHRPISATGDREEVLVQALALKSPDDLSDLDIVEFWNVENGVGIIPDRRRNRRRAFLAFFTANRWPSLGQFR
jgi:hypothetical protein